jgi:hypothetical protein
LRTVLIFHLLFLLFSLVGALPGQISCHFTNVCFDPASRDWLYYRDPTLDIQAKEAVKPTTVENGGSGTDSPSTLLDVQSDLVGGVADSLYDSSIDLLVWPSPRDIMIRSRAKQTISLSLWADALRAASTNTDEIPVSSFFRPRLIRQPVPGTSSDSVTQVGVDSGDVGIDSTQVVWAHDLLPAQPSFTSSQRAAHQHSQAIWRQSRREKMKQSKNIPVTNSLTTEKKKKKRKKKSSRHRNGRRRHRARHRARLPEVPKAFVLYEPIDAASLSHTISKENQN